MKQSRLESLLEAGVNQLTGFLVSLAFTAWVIVPLWHLDWTVSDNILVTLLFTGLSIIRSYLWRRFFNAGLHRVIHGALLHRGAYNYISSPRKD